MRHPHSMNVIIMLSLLSLVFVINKRLDFASDDGIKQWRLGRGRRRQKFAFSLIFVFCKSSNFSSYICIQKRRF
ncbi:hypothetical protein SAMN04490193_5146 [Pseudomonas marginalis]|nr:hypothetical protein SAMN04490193_5146 [Pseudomonas marginalis]